MIYGYGEEERDAVWTTTPYISYSTHTSAMPTSNRILFLLDAIILVSEVIRIFMRGRRGVMHDARASSLSPRLRRFASWKSLLMLGGNRESTWSIFAFRNFPPVSPARAFANFSLLEQILLELNSQVGLRLVILKLLCIM